jgi:hypothetical protein
MLLSAGRFRGIPEARPSGYGSVFSIAERNQGVAFLPRPNGALVAPALTDTGFQNRS